MMAQRLLGLKLPRDIPVQLAMTVMSRFDADMCLVSLSDANFYNNRTDCLETLRNSEWGGFVCGLVTQPSWSSESLDRIAHEMSMAAYFGLSSVVVPLPGFNATSTVNSEGLLSIEDAASAILRHCNSGGQTKITIDVGDGLGEAWGRYRALLEHLNLDVHGSHTDQHRTWDTFSDVRQGRGAHGMVSAMITLQADGGTFDQRWLGERLSAFVLPLNFSWATSDGVKRAPSVQRLLSARCSAILDLSGSEHVDNILGVEMLDLTQSTLAELAQAYRERPWRGEEGFAAFEEELQLPLQPLGDHLPNPTYAVFEADEVKYSKYQKAIEAYLSDVRGDPSHSIERLHIVVLGAGRGPLVSSTIQALSAKFPEGGTRALITIIEKNPFATGHLRLRMSQDSQWVEAVDHGHVRLDLIQGDGRHVGSILRKRVRAGHSPPVDLLVSELLGSIGDNELSPECIEGFMESYCSKDESANDEVTTAVVRRPVSIPREYTSYVAPVYSAALLDRVRDLCLKGGLVAHDDPICAFNTMYVVHSRRHLLLASPQPLLSFSHQLDLATNGTRGDEFKREGHSSFVATHDGVLHGFLGYFECILYNEDLYEGISHRSPSLSTNPPTRTEGMYSWFPMFIPLLPGKESDGIPFSMTVNQGEHIAFDLHRHHVKGASVWYEWGATIGTRASKRMNSEGLFGTVTL